jgi:hypothetical protein
LRSILNSSIYVFLCKNTIKNLSNKNVNLINNYKNGS